MKNKLEAKAQTVFSHWLKAEWRTSAAFELKVVRKGNFRLKQIEPHQITALKIANEAMLYHKIADTSFSPLPFDSFCLSNVPAYVVVYFIKSKTFYLIHIQKILGCIKKKKVSLSEQEIDTLADEKVDLTKDKKCDRMGV